MRIRNIAQHPIRPSVAQNAKEEEALGEIQIPESASYMEGWDELTSGQRMRIQLV